MFRSALVLVVACILAWPAAVAQKAKNKSLIKSQVASLNEAKSAFDTLDISGLKFRSIGPAVTSGRISEFAVDPRNPKRYFVAVSSGGVWRTLNNGNTFEPVFDGQGSYSIGTITMDPHNSNVIWVGSGENNNQRSVAYGDGVYKSVDGGTTWKNMGLKNSEHIGKIIVHPSHSNTVYVAAYGPLWAPGGERGVYRTKDGGQTWDLLLKLDEHTGASDLIMDPRDPNVMYAATHQRRRHVFTYLGGGPGSTIYKTTDGGLTWEKSAQGLPSVDIGRIGLAMAPSNPEVLYAMVEAAQGKNGFYRSTNRGASWEKRSDYATSGNYYVEIMTDLKDENRIYSQDVWIRVSSDGGATWKNVGEDSKHVDNHAIWMDPKDQDHVLVGCDGGIYESWDLGKNWDFKGNLPVTQFYKVSVDNATPFYNIYGGTQDNFTLGGPSRTISGNGISNDQWFVTHGGDGFETQVDPRNPNIIYSQSQHGVLVRYDKLSGEEVGIQPHEREGEKSYRWNWDSPLAVSSHVPGRIYFAANKLFVSEDRGNNWTVISDDLTRQVDRNRLKVMGRVWGIDAVAKNQSTSIYGNIVAFSESPKNPDLLFVGTDDGLIQVTTDRGKSWRKIDRIPGAPDTSYVNMLIASSHDENVVYACFNHHKYGDFKPYLFVSRDKGLTWTSISSNLPERGSVYSIAEDHVDAKLLFVGTEFSCFVTNSGGKSWKKLSNGLPTIAVRDIAIQQRENDLVLGTFGRGFYVLDDYSSLRNCSDETLKWEAVVMSVRDPWLYEYSYPLGLPKKSFQGDSYYQGENLGPVAMLTFYVKEKFVSAEDARKKEDEKLAKAGKDNAYPAYDQLIKERDEDKSKLYLTIQDREGNVVRKLPVSAEKAGLQRIHWDLRTPHKEPVSLGSPSFYNPFAGVDEGPQVAPGGYTVVLSRWKEGQMTELSEPVPFTVKALGHQSMPAYDRDAMVSFKRETEELQRVQQSVSNSIGGALNELTHVRKAITHLEDSEEKWLGMVNGIENKLKGFQRRLFGDPIEARLDMDPTPSIADRIGRVVYESKYSTSEPTGTHRASLAIAETQLKALLNDVNIVLQEDMISLRQQLSDAGAPYTPNLIPAFKRE